MKINRSNKVLFLLFFLFLSRLSFCQLDSITFDKLYEDEHDFQKIIEVTTTEINKSSVDFRQYKYRALAFARLNDFESSEPDFVKAIELNKNYIKGYLNLARIQANSKDFDAAFKYLKQASTIEPDNVSIYVLKAQIYNAQGDQLEARINYNRAISLEPENGDLYYERANFHMMHGSLQNAYRDVTKSIAIKPSSEAYYLKTRYHTDNREFNDALVSINKCIELDSLSSAYPYEIKGTVLYYLNDYEESLKAYNLAIESDSEFVQAYENRSNTNYALENMDATCDDYEKVLSFLRRGYRGKDTINLKTQIKELCDDSYSTYYYQRGIAAYNKGNYKEAIEYYDLGLEKFPKSSLIYSFKGNSLVMLNKYNESIICYNQSLALESLLKSEINDNVRFQNDESSAQIYEFSTICSNYSSIAHCYEVIGAYDKAILYCDSTLQFLKKNQLEGQAYDDCNAAVYLTLAIIANERGEYTEAKKQLKVAGLYNQYLDRVNLLNAIVILNEDNVFETKARVFNVGLNNKQRPIDVTFEVPVPVSRKVTNSLYSALGYLNKSIALNPENAMAYYLRLIVKLDLGQKEYCYDLTKAKELGLIDIEEMLNVSCD